MKLQIKKGCTVITDVDTDGKDFREEFSNPIWAEQFVRRWNEHDELVAQQEETGHLLSLQVKHSKELDRNWKAAKAKAAKWDEAEKLIGSMITELEKDSSVVDTTIIVVLQTILEKCKDVK